MAHLALVAASLIPSRRSSRSTAMRRTEPPMAVGASAALAGGAPAAPQGPMPYVSFAVFLASAVASLAWYRLLDRFRAPSPARALATLQRWCRWGCPWLRLQVRVEGTVAAVPCLYVANHRSYLDIPVLAGVLGTAFLSRADVAAWPLVGRIARFTDTVLVARDDPRNRTRAARALIRRIRTGSVVVFPEGTTTGAALPAPFHPGLFRLIQRLDVPIVPVTVRYSDRRAYWVDDVSLWQHLKTRVLQAPPLRVTVHIGSPVLAGGRDDEAQIAAAAYAAVCQPLETYGELA
jgi:1-acyl-sn-glycerol-3-phosphate acyltransferase